MGCCSFSLHAAEHPRSAAFIIPVSRFLAFDSFYHWRLWERPLALFHCFAGFYRFCRLAVPISMKRSKVTAGGSRGGGRFLRRFSAGAQAQYQCQNRNDRYDSFHRKCPFVKIYCSSIHPSDEKRELLVGKCVKEVFFSLDRGQQKVSAI